MLSLLSRGGFRQKMEKVVKNCLTVISNDTGFKSFTFRVRATDRHCRKMRRNNKFGTKNINLATTNGERKIASEILSGDGTSPTATSHCLVPLNGHQCIS